MSYKSLGIDFASVSATAEHELGLRVQSSEGNKSYVYVRADATGVAANDAVSAAASYVVTSGAANAAVFGVAPVAIAANQYGFVQVGGVVTAKLATGTAAAALLSLLGAAAAKLTTVIAVAEGGATNHAAGAQAVRGKALAAEAAGVGSIYLFNQ